MAITVNFFIPRLMPGDPASIMFARFQGKLKPETLIALKKTFGFTDAPIIIQFWDYIKHLAFGDLGISIAYFPQPVVEVIYSGIFWTMFLAGISLIISFMIGSFIGIFLAWFREGKMDSILLPSLSLIGAFPYFWLAMVLLYILGFKLNLFPLRHSFDQNIVSTWSFNYILSVIHHTILPAFTLIIVSLGGWVLAMRNNMISVLGTEYISFAKAMGYNNKVLMFKYAARNALLPSITGFGMALGFILTGALLTEIIFSYPGQGYLLLEAVRSQDYPLLQGLFLTITFTVLITNWIVDIFILILDPRTRK